MGQHHPRGWGFFLSVTATRAVRFFQPMDARWCCSNTVFQALAVVIVESRFILLSVSQSINCAASSERTIAIFACVFFGSFVFEHGCNMTREFRQEVSLFILSLRTRLRTCSCRLAEYGLIAFNSK